MRGNETQGGESAQFHHADRIPLSGRPVVIGEVLFDVFPDGERVLGGAPFNVAWHLQAFGLDPLVVTRLGDDEPGREILEAMDSWGLERGGLQVDTEAPTGQVRVTLDGGTPTFDIVADQAYDRLDRRAMLDLLSEEDLALVYHGTLIARAEPSRDALQTIRATLGVPCFVDVNLRDPWWSVPRVDSLVHGARWVKLNDAELGLLVGGGRECAERDVEAEIEAIARRHQLAEIVVTLGDQGAVVRTEGSFTAGRSERAVDVVDTVGAGDGFSAVWIAGLIAGWPLPTTLSRALDFAASICGVRGATVHDRRFYEDHRARWEEK